MNQLTFRYHQNEKEDYDEVGNAVSTSSSKEDDTHEDSSSEVDNEPDDTDTEEQGEDYADNDDKRDAVEPWNNGKSKLQQDRQVKMQDPQTRVKTEPKIESKAASDSCM